MQRTGLSHFDFYHLWICHNQLLLDEALKPGGWYEGLIAEKMQGRIKHLGITTHADPETIIAFLKTGLFETVTLPLNVVNTARIAAVKYATANNIRVIAMNPLGGGLLAGDARLKELAYKYLLALANVHILVGFTSKEEVIYAKNMAEHYDRIPLDPEEIIQEVEAIMPAKEPRCTGCGYCQPCPQFINIGASLSVYNLYKYLRLETAKSKFKSLQWNARYNIQNCTRCGACEKRCPNFLPIRQIINDAKSLLSE